jgi:hypothetical protein
VSLHRTGCAHTLDVGNACDCRGIDGELPRSARPRAPAFPLLGEDPALAVVDVAAAVSSQSANPHPEDGSDTSVEFPVPPAVNPKEVAAGGEGRIPWQALPVRPLVGAALAMGEGAHKYGRHNYRKTRIKSSVYFDSTLRHFFAWWEGEDIDAASGLHHIDKTIAGLLVLRDAQLRGMSDDDRPPACDAGWIGEAGSEFGRMRDKLTAAHGSPKPPARNDGK